MTGETEELMNDRVTSDRVTGDRVTGDRVTNGIIDDVLLMNDIQL